MSEGTKQLLVFGEKTFKITVPADVKITFGPWSPPPKGREWQERDKVGTLRIYQGSKDNIIACFGGVNGFRDLSMPYAEQIAQEQGDTLWRDDEAGYVRESRVKQSKKWVDDRTLLKGEVVSVSKKKASKKSKKMDRDVGD